MWLDKFNEMRKQSGLNLDELSQKANIPKGTLSKISAGITEKPALETMRALVYAMGYTLDDLEDNTKKQQSINNLNSIEKNIIKNYRALDEHGKKMVDYVITEETARMEQTKKEQPPTKETGQIVYLPKPIQSASAGYGQLADDETADMIGLRLNDITRKADYIMRVSGDSMEPRLYDGQNVLVNNQPAVELGEIGIFIIGGERFIKIYRGDHLESANPDYPNVQFDEYSQCIGKVLGVLQDEWIVEE